jgi:uncharacterized circularly permuted ATP-grasp superfamily protein
MLIKNNIIPAELVLIIRFFKTLFWYTTKEFHQLSLLACDIARGPDGKWLLDNRVQSPSGSGYALENKCYGKCFSAT